MYGISLFLLVRCCVRVPFMGFDILFGGYRKRLGGGACASKLYANNNNIKKGEIVLSRLAKLFGLTRVPLAKFNEKKKKYNNPVPSNVQLYKTTWPRHVVNVFYIWASTITG